MIQMPTIQIISLSKTMLQGKLLLAVFLQEVLFNFFFTFQIQTQNMLGLLVYLKKKEFCRESHKICLFNFVNYCINQSRIFI